MIDPQFLSALEIHHFVPVTRLGAGPTKNIVVSSRPLGQRQRVRNLTSERKRMGDILMQDDPFGPALLARKTVNEWIENDTSAQKPHIRLKTLRALDAYLDFHGFARGAPTPRGGWMSASTPSSQAPTVERTVLQALEAFAQMIGGRSITVIGENA